MAVSQIDDLFKEANQQREAFENAKVKCGIIGLSGAGKSSLINAIAGEKIAPVGSTEQTMEAQSYFHNGIEFVDLPGCGTQKWPQNTYISDLALEQYDCFIIVTHTRLYEADTFLLRELKTKKGKPCFIVRNKIDSAIHDEEHDNQLTEEETISKVKNNILNSIHPETATIYLTSARHPTKWDLPKLIEAISFSQAGVKRDRLIAGMAAWSKSAIKEKTGVARKIVSWSALASAANGINPIPLTDVAVDVSVLTIMCKKINAVYGLSAEQLEYIEGTDPSLSKSVEFNGLKQNILKWVTKYAVAEGVMAVLKNMGGKIIIKNISKFLPFLGSIISAGIGYKMTTAFGEQYIEEAETQAENLLETVTLR